MNLSQKLWEVVRKIRQMPLRNFQDVTVPIIEAALRGDKS